MNRRSNNSNGFTQILEWLHLAGSETYKIHLAPAGTNLPANLLCKHAHRSNIFQQILLLGLSFKLKAKNSFKASRFVSIVLVCQFLKPGASFPGIVQQLQKVATQSQRKIQLGFKQVKRVFCELYHILQSIFAFETEILHNPNFYTTSSWIARHIIRNKKATAVVSKVQGTHYLKATHYLKVKRVWLEVIRLSLFPHFKFHPNYGGMGVPKGRLN